MPTAYAHAQRHDAAGSRRALVSSLSAAALRTWLRGCTALPRAGDRGRGFAAHLSVLRRTGGDFASRDANATPRTPRAKHTVRAAAFGAGRQISDAPCSRHTARWLSCREWRVSAGTTGHGIRVRLLRECIRAAATRALASLLPFGVCSACCWRKARAHTGAANAHDGARATRMRTHLSRSAIARRCRRHRTTGRPWLARAARRDRRRDGGRPSEPSSAARTEAPRAAEIGRRRPLTPSTEVPTPPPTPLPPAALHRRAKTARYTPPTARDGHPRFSAKISRALIKFGMCSDELASFSSWALLSYFFSSGITKKTGLHRPWRWPNGDLGLNFRIK